MTVQMVDFSANAKAVFKTPVISEKKELLNGMVRGGRSSKVKQAKMLRDIQRITCPLKLDEYAANMYLYDKDAVIRVN